MTPIDKDKAIAHYAKLRMQGHVSPPPDGAEVTGYLPINTSPLEYEGVVLDTHTGGGRSWRSTNPLASPTRYHHRHILAKKP